jgi:two-component system sensor histidine kinase PilS (NtrC family)
MNRAETERQLRWLMILRVVTVTTLLICAFAIELLLRPGEAMRSLFFLAAAAYGMVLLYAALDRWLNGRRTFIYLQLIGDAVVVSGFVAITGGVDSPMTFLYLLPIIVGSMLLYRRGALVMAGGCWTLYAALVVLGGARVLPQPWIVQEALPPDPFRIGYFLVVHMAAFLAVALLASYLSERLRITGDELVERRGAVARLQALNENIIESINSGLITTDPLGRINFMNRGGVEIIGHSQHEVNGQPVERLFGLEDSFLRDARKILRSERRFRFERYFTTRSGIRIFLGIAVSNLYDRVGRPLGYIFIFQDLTEIQALEQEVRLKERMAALGGMAAGMAHELRNPLAAISGSVQYLKGSLRPAGETLELMDIILKESHRLDQAIRDFLTFARPGRFAPERVDLVKLMDDSLKLLRNSRECGPRHRIATRYTSPSVWCEVDPNRFKQVFWNLATNALKAMPDGGTLSIEISLKSEEGRVEIRFGDDGIGMDAAQMDAYFQPFNSSFAEGTGLGTAIVYRLVEEHGGKIHVRSERGRGTEVCIVLPSAQSEAVTAEHRPFARAVGG